MAKKQGIILSKKQTKQLIRILDMEIATMERFLKKVPQYTDKDSMAEHKLNKTIRLRLQ